MVAILPNETFHVQVKEAGQLQAGDLLFEGGQVFSVEAVDVEPIKGMGLDLATLQPTEIDTTLVKLTSSDQQVAYAPQDMPFCVIVNSNGAIVPDNVPTEWHKED